MYREFENSSDTDTIFSRLNFKCFVAQSNGAIIGCAHDEFGNDLTYAIASDGSVRYRKNQGVWRELAILDAASIRYFAGRFYNRLVPTYHTNSVVI